MLLGEEGAAVNRVKKGAVADEEAGSEGVDTMTLLLVGLALVALLIYLFR